MTRTVAQKMGLRPGSRAVLLGAPDSARDAMNLPDLDRRSSLRGQFDYIHLFVRTAAEMRRRFPRARAHLAPGGALWLSWPKGQAGGLKLQQVIRIGYGFGLVESTTLRVDEAWSAIKFTHPKPGKVYRNSYGALPAHR
jgi:hypothetical protein